MGKTMNYILTIKTTDGPEREIEMETSNKEEAISNANPYVRGGEGLVDYAVLSDGDTVLEYCYSSCEWEESK